jgi:hypothetical protein
LKPRADDLETACKNKGIDVKATIKNILNY